MTSPGPRSPSATPPSWPHCGQGATSADPVGCRGIRVGSHPVCLAHLAANERAVHLATLWPGAPIDHRGTPFTSELLDQLLAAVRDPSTNLPRLGEAQFEDAAFLGDASFGGATFSGDARFIGATFSGVAWFANATFSGDTQFFEAAFSGDAWFANARFSESSNVGFTNATFSGKAWFIGTKYPNGARFTSATFSRAARFDGATFSRFATFSQVRFEAAQQVGPLLCEGEVDLSGVVFCAPVTVEAVAKRVSLRRARWESSASLRFRYAEVDLTGAVLEYPLTLTTEPAPFRIHGGPDLPEGMLAGRDDRVRIGSVSGVDCAFLTLTDIDLSRCRFAGAVHLDQLRLEGSADFAQPPTGWHAHGPLPLRWSRRRTLAEEHHWRAATSRPASRTPQGWQPGPHHPHLERTPGPERVAAIYRQLRKALEDGKNEPGASDFYYGECEMRRHDHTSTPRAERWLLAMYWAISGYGLRASRSLAWLLGAMTATVLVMMLWGIPSDDPQPVTTGRQVDAGQNLVLTTDTPPPANPTGPLAERLTTDRFEKSLRVVVNSAVFRTSGQDLTTAGNYTEMASRFSEPVFLTLAALAIRARVKR